MFHISATFRTALWLTTSDIRSMGVIVSDQKDSFREIYAEQKADAARKRALRPWYFQKTLRFADSRVSSGRLFFCF